MQNLLPYDGEAFYLKNVFTTTVADQYFSALEKNILWEHDEGILFGKHYITDRMVAWYGDQPFVYSYSKAPKEALPWTKTLLAIKKTVEEEASCRFNSCLLNYYHHGDEGMGWHSDNEKEMLKEGTIASLSLGATRKFSFKHKKTKETVALELTHGSLLLKKKEIQEHWLHSLPKTKKVNSSRINLTYRIYDGL